jgi:hypothetical protein
MGHKCLRGILVLPGARLLELDRSVVDGDLQFRFRFRFLLLVPLLPRELLVLHLGHSYYDVRSYVWILDDDDPPHSLQGQAVPDLLMHWGSIDQLMSPYCREVALLVVSCQDNILLEEAAVP